MINAPPPPLVGITTGSIEIMEKKMETTIKYIRVLDRDDHRDPSIKALKRGGLLIGGPTLLLITLGTQGSRNGCTKR